MLRPKLLALELQHAAALRRDAMNMADGSDRARFLAAARYCVAEARRIRAFIL